MSLVLLSAIGTFETTHHHKRETSMDHPDHRETLEETYLDPEIFVAGLTREGIFATTETTETEVMGRLIETFELETNLLIEICLEGIA
jgi:hypothetical protein